MCRLDLDVELEADDSLPCLLLLLLLGSAKDEREPHLPGRCLPEEEVEKRRRAELNSSGRVRRPGKMRLSASEGTEERRQYV